ncbi:hypothetical protein EBT31_14260 [bacterium]|nr:hypothetical protein [bacterium]
MTAGREHALAIKTDGTLWAWGSGDSGRLGLNDTADRSSPVQVGALTTWAQVAAGGGGSTFAIKTDGTLWSWGYNYTGNLGLNDSGPYTRRSSPVQIGALTTWKQISAGDDHALAIKTDGTLWTWGNNGSGRLGLGDTANRSSPVQIGALTTWSQAGGALSHSVSLKTDGTLWSWGSNTSGRLGLNDTINRSSPVQIGALTSWVRIPTNMSQSVFSSAIKS